MRKLDIDRNLFVDLYDNQKKSGLEIARLLGIGRSTVTRYIHEFGLTPRTGKEVLANNPRKPMGERHRDAVRAAGKLRVGALNPMWKGGSWTDDKGYRRVSYHGRYRLEHRVVMEQELGRKLRPHEDVHHLNGDKTDNRPGNLLVLDRVQHGKLHGWITNGGVISEHPA